MLQSFSDRIRNSRWLGYGIVMAIAIPFALLGIEAYLGNGGGEVAAEVNGVPIQNAQVEQQVSQRRAQLREQLGGEFPEMLSEGLRERVLDQLILREVLRQAAADARMRIPPERLAARIREQEQFRQDGQFHRELYRQLVQRWGLTEQEYETHMRSAYRVEQLRDGITTTGFALPAEGRESARLVRAERQVAVLEHARERAAERVSISPEDVQAYYERNRESFQTPPRLRVAYIELSREELAAQFDVTEQELRAEYRQRQSDAEESGERQAAHVLLEVPDGASEEEVQAVREEAQRLRERVVSGEAEFATVAREHSDDPGSADQGGGLGYVGRGSMVRPFEEALFSLEESGAVSEPVRTSFGFHLIKLLDVRGESESSSFEAARDEIEQRIRREKAEQLFRDRADLLRNTAYENPGSLEPVAEATGLEIEESGWFASEGGDGIAAEAAVREAAFSADVRQRGVNSDLLDLGDGRVAVVRVVGEQASEARPLDQVRDRIRQRLREQRTDEILAQWAETMQERLEEGAAPADLAGEDAAYRDLGWVRRDGGETDPEVAAAAFESAAPSQGDAPNYQAATLASGGRAIVIVRAARLPEVDGTTVQEARGTVRQDTAGAEMSAWAEALRNAADITRN